MTAADLSDVQYSTVQYSTVQYSTVQYSTVQYSTVQYSTVQYSGNTIAYLTLHSFFNGATFSHMKRTFTLHPQS